MRPVLIFGASRGVGLLLAKKLRHDGVPVLAMLRSDTGRAELDAEGVRIAQGDAFSRTDLERAFSLLQSEFDVVSTLGGCAPDGEYADDVGNINVIDEAARRGVARFVLVTSIGCGEMAPFRSERAIAAFGAAVDAKTRAEEHMKRTIAQGTAIRPGGLRSEPATGRGILTTDAEMHGFIHRADVADLVARALRDAGTAGRAFAAVDRDQAKSVNPIAPFPLAA
ncbi:epimerase [Hyphomicrobium nitrativorans NL23]|uniref:Epimerase n=1 Tax=Hyphomicrobium nitrativorans NL23 TaxID=1029756 RepID=V5SC57_9HYPH|nr:NAD(P)H-binding protein [Hyphomicrobium nitrativorans]AHB47554.1 epimerase [Hyphomicrobium nitrativorans NL23]